MWQLPASLPAERPYRLIAGACAVFAIALGLMTLTGWATGQARLVQMRPEWTPMVVNTAIGFILSGLALLATMSGGRWTRIPATVLCVVIAALAIEELLVLALDISPALSLPELHRSLQPGYPHPGRMAPNTALCFLLFGSGLFAFNRHREGDIALWVQRAGVAVLAIGLLGVIGYSLQLEYLYGWSGVVRMAVHTGVGMVVLGFALWALARASADRAWAQRGNEVTGVYRIATMLFVILAASAGIGGFAFMQDQVQSLVRAAMTTMRDDRIAAFEQTIDYRSVRAEVAAQDSSLAGALRNLHDSGRPALPALEAWAGRLRGEGFSSIGVRVDSQTFQLTGTPPGHEFSVALHGEQAGRLVWREGYLLERTVPVRDRDGIAGFVVMRQSLKALDDMSRLTNSLGESGEMVVCGALVNAMDCFPSRSRPAPGRLPQIVNGQLLPMAYALAGITGSRLAFDYRNHRVLAAYGPIGDTGLGLVVKRDIAEIYRPVRSRFQLIMVFLAGLVGITLYILRRRLQPLLHALQEGRVRALAAMESNLDAYFILECLRDADGKVTDLRYVLMNKRAERVLDRPRGEVIGKGMCELFPERRSDGMLALYAAAVESGTPIIEERSAIAGDGSTRWYHLQAVKLGDGLGVTVRDITSARLASEQIRHQAMHDPLTGLANRAGFEVALASAMAESRLTGHAIALALIDVDGFKGVNDMFGHAAGDQLLQAIAARLRDCVRPSDTVARLGGDEFVIVLPDIRDPDGAAVVARKLLVQVATPVDLDGRDTVVTISVGISLFPRDGTESAQLLKAADAAMYQAKRAGRNGFAFHDASNPR